MKTLTFSALLLLPALAAAPAVAQTRTAAKPAAAPVKTTTATKPATTTKATTAAAKPAAPAKSATQAAPAEATPAEAPAAATKSAPKAASQTSSATNNFVKGSTAINLGVGLGLGYGYYGGSLKATPAMSLSVERGFIEGLGPGTIGIGALIGYKGYSYDYGGSQYKAKWTNLLVSARGTYHYNILENPKLDTYAGISVGVRMQTWKDTYYDNTPGLKDYSSSSAYVTSGFFIGGRYFFTDNIGAFSEIGYDMNYLKLGLTAKF
ncbi:hypothetical protein [Hymenobacter koreensis]|uniref:Outer membrane protein beta-barrel domain-containing protein n=1 Tax=Hymenobacter koreensis TaxID=1084523 RepID=A0ABP8J052_9BACT